MVFITTATGQIGSVAAAALVQRGIAVRGGSRDPHRISTLGVEPVRFDFQEPATFDAALAGVSTVFVLTPPGFADALAVTGPFVRAAVARGLRIVTMTAAGVEYAPEAPMRKLELLAETSPGGFAHVRPSWFAQNFETFWKHGIVQAGVIALPAGDAKTTFIDVRDIGEAAAAVLADPSTNGQAYRLTGPDALTYAEAATILSKASGRPIRYESIDDATFAAGLVAAGVPADYTQLMVILFSAVRAGGAAEVDPTIERLIGRKPRSLESYASDRSEQWAVLSGAHA